MGLGYEKERSSLAQALSWWPLHTALRTFGRTALFWAAFILTRPLGATLGDLLDKPVANGGLDVNRFYASAILALVIIVCILVIPQRAGRHPGAATS